MKTPQAALAPEPPLMRAPSGWSGKRARLVIRRRVPRQSHVSRRCFLAFEALGALSLERKSTNRERYE